MDSMSFIFRAYHAMVRQRGMSTRTGVPTAATYVFVNMLRKLRDDFSPQFLAAVFDVAAPTFRDQQAEAITTVRKFDIKTQQFQEIKYAGYKANRAEMPGDLVQQLPYIRRALDAYRIPILEQKGYEADDVIGTLAKQAVARGYSVYVVSSDKDMLQLVNDHVCVLNPPKDNLLCDAAKVEEILGVPPERVVDVMALRGDSIDNIPGAPGIGDKGSVELIKRFGSVEAALDHASEVERKTYRESLLNNREAVMFSKKMATIDCDVPLELDIEGMRMGQPDVESLRALFTELEFTSLLKELLPVVEVSDTNYTEAKSAADVEAVLRKVSNQAPLAVALELAAEQLTPVENEEEADRDPTLPLSDGGRACSPGSRSTPQVSGPPIAISAAPGTAITVDNSDSRMRLISALADEKLPKAIHDLKAALHALEPEGITLRCVEHDSALYSYLLDPTYPSHRLADVALRRFNLKMSGTLAESADVTGRLAIALRHDVEDQRLLNLYGHIDLPLVAVLHRMEHA
jgi:DNA polymerase I